MGPVRFLSRPFQMMFLQFQTLKQIQECVSRSHYISRGVWMAKVMFLWAKLLPTQIYLQNCVGNFTKSNRPLSAETSNLTVYRWIEFHYLHEDKQRKYVTIISEKNTSFGHFKTPKCLMETPALRQSALALEVMMKFSLEDFFFHSFLQTQAKVSSKIKQFPDRAECRVANVSSLFGSSNEPFTLSHSANSLF